MITLNEKNKVEETGNFQVYNRTLVYGDTVIQLRNIAMIVVAPMKKQQMPSWALISIVLGLICFSFNAMCGLLLLAFGGITCAYIYTKNSNLGHYLTLELNNGKSLYFQAKSEDFLKSVTKCLADSMNSNGEISFVVDLKNASIMQMNVDKMQMGDNNTMR